MKFYAKSKKRVPEEVQKQRLMEALERLEERLGGELTEEERKILRRASVKIQEIRPEEPKELEEHLKETEECARRFFEIYGQYFTTEEQELICFACRIHDLGKLNLIFQDMIGNETLPINEIRRREDQIPHGFLSVLSITEEVFRQQNASWKYSDYCALLTAVYHHHTREDKYTIEQIISYAEKYYEPYLKAWHGEEMGRIEPAVLNKILFHGSGGVYPECQLTEKKKTAWMKYLVCKGMLNKFDWAVSAGYPEAEIKPDLQKRELKKNIETQLTSLHPVQAYMEGHGQDNLIITAGTGSGKTEAALLWLNGEKGFYTLPLKVSANAIYERITRKYEFSDAALVHSDSMVRYLYEEQDSDGFERYQKAKNLSCPLTVCTVDQLFKFVFRALGTEVFAATLKYSKVIIDEIQAYSPELTAALIYGLKTVKELGGRYSVITATFPPVLRTFMDRYGLNEGNGAYRFRDFSVESQLKRHWIEIRETSFDFDEIAEQGRKKKILVLCNTVTQAQKVCEELEARLEDGDVFLLHSRYIRRHRAILERMILDFSEREEEPGIWVSTQIVEASLDIDFDMLYTEMCTADSLLQRLGRCNRKGRYIPAGPNVIVLVNQNGIGKNKVYDPVVADRSLKYLRPFQGGIFTEVQKTGYINRVYDPKEIEETEYYQTIEKYLQHFDMISPAEYTKEEADKEFRHIQSITVMPDCIFHRKRELIEEGLRFQQTPYAGGEAKAVIRSRIEELTLNVNIYSNRWPDHIDRDTICVDAEDNIVNLRNRRTDIHRSQLKYEFDEETGKGAGLRLDTVDQEECFI